MGLFNQFPFTNFHEMNLDWLITTMKKSVERIDDALKNLPEEVQSSVKAEVANQITNIPPDMLNYYRNKHIWILGDSISSEESGQHRWPSFARELLAQYNTTITNASKNGASLREIQLEENFPSGKVDIIVIFAGVNDYHWQRPAGAGPTESDEDTLWYNAARIAQKIREHNAETPVFYISPMITTALNHPVHLNYYRYNLKNIAGLYGWTIIDGLSMPMLSSETPALTSFLPDKLHPSPAYSDIMGLYILRTIFNGAPVTTVDQYSSYNLTMPEGVTGYAIIQYCNNKPPQILAGINNPGANGIACPTCKGYSGVIRNPFNASISLVTDSGTIGQYTPVGDKLVPNAFTQSAKQVFTLGEQVLCNTFITSVNSY